MSRATYIWDKRSQDWVPLAAIQRPRRADGVQVVRDIEPYRSVRTGEMIGGRKQHRDHLRAYGLVEVGNDYAPPQRDIGPKRGEIAADIKRALGE